MPTYSATNHLTKPAAAHGLGGNVKAYFFEIVCPAAPTTADPLNFGFVPANFRLLGATLESTDMDTAGPTITINVGDAGSANRLFAASTVAQAGTAAVASAVTGLHHLYTAKTLITGVAAANATTGAAGTLSLSVWGIIEDSATS